MVFSEFIIIVFATVDLRWLVGFHHAVLHHGRDDLLISGLYRPKCLELVLVTGPCRCSVLPSVGILVRFRNGAVQAVRPPQVYILTFSVGGGEENMIRSLMVWGDILFFFCD